MSRALRSTHAAVNAAVHYYESKVLILPGDGYEAPEGPISRDAVREGFRRLIHEARGTQQHSRILLGG